MTYWTHSMDVQMSPLVFARGNKLQWRMHRSRVLLTMLLTRRLVLLETLFHSGFSKLYFPSTIFRNISPLPFSPGQNGGLPTWKKKHKNCKVSLREQPSELKANKADNTAKKEGAVLSEERSILVCTETTMGNALGHYSASVDLQKVHSKSIDLW